MGDNMKKVRSGDSLDIPAATFNTFIDSARDFLSRQSDMNRACSKDTRNSGIILVKNASGEDRARFEILGIKEPVISVSDNEEQFKNRIALTGELPTESDHAGKFVILLEPLKADSIGMAMAMGICQVKINIESEDHSHADVKDDDATTLQSNASGAAQILWKESGTGIKWCTIRFPMPQSEGGSYNNPYDLLWTQPTESPYLLECDYPDRTYDSIYSGEWGGDTVYAFDDIPEEQAEAEDPQSGVIIQQAVDFRIDEASGFQKLICNFHYDTSGKLKAITNPQWHTFAYVKTCYFPTPTT